MTYTQARDRIVVGVDGSAASTAAVRWAVREARLRHGAVHLVCACDGDASLRAPYASWSWETREEERLAAAAAMLAAEAAAVRSHLPPGRLTTELVREPPVGALLDRAENADMLVIGTTRSARGSGQPPRDAGPVARACLRLASCPVVLIAPNGQLPTPSSALGPVAPRQREPQTPTLGRVLRPARSA